jgi:hypothetical protein
LDNVQRELYIARTLLLLRKQKLIGVVWAEQGRFYISEDEFDPFGSRHHYNLEQLEVLIASCILKKEVGRVNVATNANVRRTG